MYILQKKRNCMASAKYRKKKQVELQKLQMQVHDLFLERERLLEKIEQLEEENRDIHKQLLAVAISKS
jgi:hypothetical protein